MTIASMIYVLEAQTASIEQSLKTVTSLVDSVDQKMQGSIISGVALGDALETMGQKVLTTAVTAVEGLVSELADLTMQGSHVADVEAGFDRLTEGAGHLGSTLLTELKAGTHGTIDDFDLMKSVNRDLAAGLNLTDDQFGTLAQGAFALAKVTGGDTATAMESLNEAMLTGRTRAVALLTGKIDLKAAEEAFANSLGVTASDLTAEGKLEAAREAILTHVQDALGRVGQQQDSLADKVQQAKVEFDDLEESLGKAIATSPVIIEAFTGIEQILLDTFGDDPQQRITALKTIIENLAIGVVGFASDAVQAGALVLEGWDALKVVFLSVYDGLLHIESGLLKVEIAAVEAKAFVEPWNDFSKAIADLKGHLQDVQDTLATNQKSIAADEASEASWAAAGQTMADKLDTLKQKLIDAQAAETAFVGPIQKEAEAHEAAGKAADDHAKYIVDWGKTAAAQAAATAKLWDEYYKLVNAADHDRVTAQINDAWLAADAEIAAMEKTKTITLEDYDIIWAKAQQTADNIIQKTLESDKYTKEHYQLLADQAEAAYNFALDHASSYTQQEMQLLAEKYREAEQASNHWAQAAYDDMDKAAAGATKMVAAVKSIADEVETLSGEWIKAADAKKLFDQGSSFTYDLTTTAGVDQYRQMNTGMDIGWTDDQIIAFAKHGGTLQQLMQMGVIHMKPFAAGGVVPDYYASGGPIGTDTVPAWLTPGEGIVTTTGMQGLGPAGLAAINSGRGGGDTHVQVIFPGNVFADRQQFTQMVKRVMTETYTKTRKIAAN